MASKKTRNFWLNEFSLFTSLLIWKREQVISNVPITNPRCEMISQAPVPEVTRYNPIDVSAEYHAVQGLKRFSLL